MRKHDYDKVIFRLTTIFSRLNLGEKLHPRELAEEFNVSVRTVQKDLNERLQHIYPIERTSDGRYQFENGFNLEAGIDHDQYIALSLIDCFMAQVHPGLQKSLREAINGTHTEDNPFILELGFEELNGYFETFRLLRQSIKFRQSIEFMYTNKHDETANYQVDPYKIANFHGFWYLIAFDKNESKLKTFYLKAIQKVLLSPENYIINEEIEQGIQNTYGTINSAWCKAESFEVTLKATGHAKRYLERNLPVNIFVVEVDGQSMVLKMKYFKEIEVLSLVKRWIPDISIIDNPELNASLKGHLFEYLNND